MRLRKSLIGAGLIVVLVLSCGVEKTDKGTGIPDSTPPAQITDLAAINPTDSSLVLTWTAPGDDDANGTAAQYDIRFHSIVLTDSTWDSALQPFSLPIPQEAGTPETMLVLGLLPDTTYYFGIKAADEVPNWSAISNIATGTTEAVLDTVPPAAIADLRVTDAGYTFIELSWTVPGDDGSAGTAAAYDIRYSPTTLITDEYFIHAKQVADPPTPWLADSTQQYTFYDLDTNENYCFAIKTADEVPNWSAMSNVIIGATAADTTPPGPIADLRVLDTTSTSLLLIWTAPGDDDTLGRASFYDIRYSPRLMNEVNFPDAQIAPNLPKPSFAGTGDTIRISGLQSETEYYIALKTGDEMLNWSTMSNVLAARTASIDRTPPGAIIDLRIIDSSLTSLTLSWTAPGDDGDVGTASLYDLRYSTSVINETNFRALYSYPGVTLPLSSGSPETLMVTGLTKNTAYHFAIKTADEVQNWSPLSNDVLGIARPGTDTIPPAAITNLYPQTVSHNSVTLIWNASGDDSLLGQAAQYDMRYATSPITDDTWSEGIPAEGLRPAKPVHEAESFEIIGLTPGLNYFLALKTADTSGNWSGLSNVAEAKTTTLSNTWYTIIGGTGRKAARSITLTPEGGAVAVGTIPNGVAYWSPSYSPQSTSDFYATKVNADGTVAWERVFGHGPDYDDYLFSIIPAWDGGYIAAGESGERGGLVWDTRVVIARIDDFGSIGWERLHYVDGATVVAGSRSVAATSDGGYVLSGSVGGNPAAFLFKTDAIGQETWKRQYSGYGGNAVIQCHDTGLMIAGVGLFVTKTDAQGKNLWGRDYGQGAYYYNDSGESLIQYGIDDYVIAGWTQASYFGMKDGYVIWIDSLGNKRNELYLGGGNDDAISKIIAVSDGNFVVVGSTKSFGAGKSDMYVAKISPTATILWERTIGDSESDGATGVIEAPDGGLIISGWMTAHGATSADFSIIKTDANGEL
jgi:chitodextrinase